MDRRFSCRGDRRYAPSEPFRTGYEFRELLTGSCSVGYGRTAPYSTKAWLRIRSTASSRRRHAEQEFKTEPSRGIACARGSLPLPPLRGASVWKLMQVSRHRSVAALQGYVRDRDGYRDHAGLGLL
jgi:hypothetical protein